MKEQQSFDIGNIQLVFSNLIIDSNTNKHDTSLKAKWSRFKSRQKIRKAKRNLLRNIKIKQILRMFFTAKTLKKKTVLFTYLCI